mgnify:CR=1 FL=1
MNLQQQLNEIDNHFERRPLEEEIEHSQQLIESLRSELNRLKTESTLLLKSMKNATAAGIEASLGNERV